MVRWRCASALRPSPSRLPPGAGNKAQKAKKGEEKRPERYRAGIRLELVERHGYAAAVVRHEDGDGAAILPIEEAQLASSGSVRRACDGSRRITGFVRSSTCQVVNAPRGDGASRDDDGPGPAGLLPRPTAPSHRAPTYPRPSLDPLRAPSHPVSRPALCRLRTRRVRGQDLTRDVVLT